MLTNKHHVHRLIAHRLVRMHLRKALKAAVGGYRFEAFPLSYARHADGQRVHESCLRAALLAMRRKRDIVNRPMQRLEDIIGAANE